MINYEKDDFKPLIEFLNEINFQDEANFMNLIERSIRRLPIGDEEIQNVKSKSLIGIFKGFEDHIDEFLKEALMDSDYLDNVEN